MGAVAKFLSHDHHPIELVFWRNLIGLCFLVPSLLRNPPKQTGGKPLLLVFRGLIGTTALYLFFYNIAHIGLGEANTYNLSYPIYLAVFSAFLPGQRLTLREWAAVGIGFAGIVLIFRPEGGYPVAYHLIGIGSGVCAAMALMSIGELRKAYDSRTIVLSFMTSGTIVPVISFALYQLGLREGWELISAPVYWPGWQDLLGLVALGGLAAAGQLLLTIALGWDKAGRLGALNYVQVVFALLLGVLLGDDWPQGWVVLGMVLVVVSGVVNMRRKRPLEAERAPFMEKTKSDA